MFTTYIHTLEVLAMHLEGATVNKIVSMGFEWSPQHISATLKWLEKEGYVKRWKAGRGFIWQITEKAIDACDTVVRKRELAENEAMFTETSESVPSEASKTSQEAITDVSENTQDVMQVIETENGYFMSTDDDGVPNLKYVGLIADDGSLPLDAIPPHDDIFDDPDYEAERCQYCDSSLYTVYEQETGVCSNCQLAVYH